MTWWFIFDLIYVIFVGQGHRLMFKVRTEKCPFLA